MDIDREYEHAMSLVAEVEKGPLSKFSAETRASADLIRVVDTYHRLVAKKTDFVIEVELEQCRAKLVRYEQDYKAKATEFRIKTPEPGTDEARLMHVAKSARERVNALEIENLELLAEIDELKAENRRQLVAIDYWKDWSKTQYLRKI